MTDWWSEDQGGSSVKAPQVVLKEPLLHPVASPGASLFFGRAVLESKATPAASKEREMQTSPVQSIFPHH